jgi:hypothetical protein
MAQSICTKNDKVEWIQIGTEPGWRKPVLNVKYRDVDTVISAPISRKVEQILLDTGFGSEG